MKKDINLIRNEIDTIDKEMASLFEKRMALAKEVALYKKENSLPVFDSKREKSVIENNSVLISNTEIRNYYRDFIISTMNISKKYQKFILNQQSFLGKTIDIHSKKLDYRIYIKKGILNELSSFIDKDKKILIVSDSGVPNEYVQSVKSQFKNSSIFIIEQGEKNKSLESLEQILSFLISQSFTRKDFIVALGGGVVGDIAGLAASLYMRGIRFYNIPTTVLSMVDSSIGGKTAIDFCNVKNIVGTFYSPSAVFIDVSLLKTLNNRLKMEGLAESIKMSLTHNVKLFEMIECMDDFDSQIENIIYESLLIKKKVVEEDENESGSRQSLNFGHTFGHAFEICSDGSLYHGEAVSIGMTYMISDAIRERVISVLKKFHLPISQSYDKEQIIQIVAHDKKSQGSLINVVFVNEIGSYEIRQMSLNELEDLL